MSPKKTPCRKHLPRGLDILYEDDMILVVRKPAGLLTMAADNSRNKTLYYVLTDYVRKGNPKSPRRVYIVHRLDQWTSGVLIFAKSEEAKLTLQSNWEQTEKKYLAVVWGRPTPDEGTITSYLAENKAFRVYSTNDRSKGKLSHTAYRVIKDNGRFSLLEITLLTGRKNQIRVHLADKGCPIVGDRKYGISKDTHRRLALHAKSISFKHPADGRPMSFETPMPDELQRLMKASNGIEQE